MILYSLRTQGDGYAIAKFDDYFHVEAVYNLTPKGNDYACDCPAGSRNIVLKPCKHRKMVKLMREKADTDEFYCYEDGHWYRPLDLSRAAEGVEDETDEDGLEKELDDLEVAEMPDGAEKDEHDYSIRSKGDTLRETLDVTDISYTDESPPEPAPPQPSSGFRRRI